MNILYPAKIKFDKRDNRYFVQFPDFEEAITEGTTLKEAVDNASEVLTLTLEARMDEKMKIPKPGKSKKGTFLIAPSARVQAALLIRFNKGKHTKSEIARAIGTSWPAVSRLEDPHHWPSLRQLEKAAAAIGKRLVLELEPIPHNS